MVVTGGGGEVEVGGGGDDDDVGDSVEVVTETTVVDIVSTTVEDITGGGGGELEDDVLEDVGVVLVVVSAGGGGAALVVGCSSTTAEVVIVNGPLPRTAGKGIPENNPRFVTHSVCPFPSGVQIVLDGQQNPLPQSIEAMTGQLSVGSRLVCLSKTLKRLAALSWGVPKIMVKARCLSLLSLFSCLVACQVVFCLRFILQVPACREETRDEIQEREEKKGARGV